LYRHGLCCWFLDRYFVGGQMITVEIKGYVYYRQMDWDDTGTFIISQYPPEIMIDSNHKFIIERHVFVEVPEIVDMRQVKINALQEEKQKIEAEFAAKVTQINRKINELLAIENQI
jgi:hypothetical protein